MKLLSAVPDIIFKFFRISTGKYLQTPELTLQKCSNFSENSLKNIVTFSEYQLKNTFKFFRIPTEKYVSQNFSEQVVSSVQTDRRLVYCIIARISTLTIIIYQFFWFIIYFRKINHHILYKIYEILVIDIKKNQMCHTGI